MKYVKNQIAARTNLEQIIHVQYAGLVSFVLLAINKAARQRLCQKWPSLEESGATDPRQGHQCSCQAKPFLLLPPFLRFTFSWHDSYVVWVGKQVKLVEIGLDWFSVSVPPTFSPLLIFLLLKKGWVRDPSRRKLWFDPHCERLSSSHKTRVCRSNLSGDSAAIGNATSCCWWNRDTLENCSILWGALKRRIARGPGSDHGCLDVLPRLLRPVCMHNLPLHSDMHMQRGPPHIWCILRVCVCGCV